MTTMVWQYILDCWKLCNNATTPNRNPARGPNPHCTSPTDTWHGPQLPCVSTHSTTTSAGKPDDATHSSTMQMGPTWQNAPRSVPNSGAQMCHTTHMWHLQILSHQASQWLATTSITGPNYFNVWVFWITMVALSDSTINWCFYCLIFLFLFLWDHDLIEWPMLFYYGSHCDNTIHILTSWFGWMSGGYLLQMSATVMSQVPTTNSSRKTNNGDACL